MYYDKYVFINDASERNGGTLELMNCPPKRKIASVKLYFPKKASVENSAVTPERSTKNWVGKYSLRRSLLHKGKCTWKLEVVDT